MGSEMCIRDRGGEGGPVMQRRRGMVESGRGRRSTESKRSKIRCKCTSKGASHGGRPRLLHIGVVHPKKRIMLLERRSPYLKEEGADSLVQSRQCRGTLASLLKHRGSDDGSRPHSNCLTQVTTVPSWRAPHSRMKASQLAAAGDLGPRVPLWPALTNRPYFVPGTTLGTLVILASYLENQCWSSGLLGS